MNINKPIVKQFVADWYEANKENFDKNLFEFIYYVVSYYIKNEPKSFEDFESLFEEWKRDDFKRWMSQAYENGAITTLVNMHQYGYEVEKETKKETKYVIKVKALDQYLCNDGFTIGFRPDFRTNFTKNELENLGLGWVFDCEGIEIEKIG